MSPSGQAVLRRLAGPLAWLTAAAAVAATAGCAAEAKSDDEPSPFAACATLAAPPAVPATTDANAAADLPDLRLPCFAGGPDVALTSLRGPAVINLWGSWCGPCRTELPVMQSFADRAAGRITVLGVDTGDRRAAGASFAADQGVRLPTLFDEDRKLLNALAGTALPMTVFLDSAGHKTVYFLPLDARGLAEQARLHTGVTVTP